MGTPPTTNLKWSESVASNGRSVARMACSWLLNDISRTTSGQHAKDLLVIIEEASGVEDEI